MKKFSLQKPRIRNYLHEWVFHELLGEGNLVKINYDFYDFYLNGEYQGFYNLEEGFGKTLLERNDRRNGPIFSIYEEIKEDSDSQKFEIYNKNYWTRAENIDVAQKAIQNLNNYFDGKTNYKNVFDIKKWAWFFAAVDLTYTYHGATIKSVKFYYNPINEKIEPIGYDGHRLLPNFSENILPYKPELNQTIYDLVETKISYKWLKNLLYTDEKVNEIFYKEYVKSINKIANKSYLNIFFDNRKKDIKRISSGIYTDDYIFDYDSSRGSGIGIYYFDKKEIYRRAEFLLDKIKINKSKLFIEANKNKVQFLSFDKNNLLLKNPKLICDNGDHNLKMNSNFHNKKIEINFENSELFYNCHKVSFKNSINDELLLYEINKYNLPNQISNFFEINNFLDYFDIYEKNNLALKTPTTVIDKFLYIPENYIVNIFPSQKIILSNNAFIFSKSPWNVVGGPESLIHIMGEEKNFGGGIIITDTDDESVFKYVNFQYLNGIKKDFYSGNIVTGAINFNNTKVVLKNILVEKINAEDAINIFNSKFYVENGYLSENFSDAIDFDFSNGKVKNIEFNSIGNDALDFSGSKASVENVIFNNIGDKVISVGENSSLNIYNIKGKNSLIGIASKDGSKTYVENIKFVNVDYPFAAYKKKEVYEHGKLHLNNFSANGFKKQYIRDFNSIIFDEKLNKKLGKSDKEIDEIIENII